MIGHRYDFQGLMEALSLCVERRRRTCLLAFEFCPLPAGGVEVQVNGRHLRVLPGGADLQRETVRLLSVACPAANGGVL